MLQKLHYTVSTELLQEAEALIPQAENRYVINEPTGRFFYDPWHLKAEYQNTVWENILATLPMPIGEARIMVLKPGTAYNAHADLDDRYHLNINGEACYLIDLDNNQMHNLERDGNWYEMDAGRVHTAANFGRYYRVQLVVRKLLNDATLTEPVKVKILPTISNVEDARFIFDQTVSKWISYASKNNVVSNVNVVNNIVEFDIEKLHISKLLEVLPTEFKLDIQ